MQLNYSKSTVRVEQNHTVYRNTQLRFSLVWCWSLC